MLSGPRIPDSSRDELRAAVAAAQGTWLNQEVEPGRAERGLLTLTNYVTNRTTFKLLIAAAVALFAIAVLTMPASAWVSKYDQAYPNPISLSSAEADAYCTYVGKPGSASFWSGKQYWTGGNYQFQNSGFSWTMTFANNHASDWTEVDVSIKCQGTEYGWLALYPGPNPTHPTAHFHYSVDTDDLPYQITTVWAGVGTPDDYTWTISPTSGTYLIDDEESAAFFLEYEGTYEVTLYVVDGAYSDTQTETIVVSPEAPPTPTPSPGPTTPIPITPGPTVTIAPIDTFGTWDYDRDQTREDLEEKFGNLTGPYLDITDSIASGITSLFAMVFYIPNMPVSKLVDIITTMNDIGDQALSLFSSSANTILQMVKICLDALPWSLQLLIIWVLVLDFTYVVTRGET